MAKGNGNTENTVNNTADNTRNKIDNILHDPICIIAFITALFYICIYSYNSAYYGTLSLPLSIRDLSFIKILSSGYMIAQLMIIFVLLIYPLYIIYKYPNNKLNWIIPIAFTLLIIIKLLDYIILMNSEFKIAGWIEGWIFVLIVLAFVFYLIMFTRYKKEIIGAINVVAVDLKSHHFYYLIVVIILLSILTFHYLGDRAAQDFLNGETDRYMVHIVPKDQNLSFLNKDLPLIMYKDGNYYLLDENSSYGRITHHIIRDSEIKNASLQLCRGYTKLS